MTAHNTHFHEEIGETLTLDPFMSSGLFYQKSLDWSISNNKVSGHAVFIITCTIMYVYIFNVNSRDPDLIHSAAFDLDLHLLPIYPFWGFQTEIG